MQPLKKEVEAVAAALEQPHESAAHAAKAAIAALDKARTERVTYFAVLRFGKLGVFSGFGPYSTQAQATKAIEKHPAAGMATAYAVVPTLTDEGLDALIARVDAPVRTHGDWTEVEKDKQARRNGWRGKANTRERYL